jgi:SAM-dependent methyltransferase
MIKRSAISRFDPTWFDHQRHSLVALREALIQTLNEDVRPQTGQKVADLGAGDSPYRPLFTAGGAQYIACDLEGDADVMLKSSEPVPLDSGSIDIVVSFQVLEHVWDLDWYLGECFRLLKPGGRLILSTHGSWLYHPHPTDFRRWTRDGLEREIASRGFIETRLKGLVGPLAWTTQFRLLGIREVLRKIPVVRSTVLPVVTLLSNVRMVAEDAITPAAIRDTNACIYLTVSRKP